MEQRNVNEVIYRDDLYPRFEANQALIQRYANSIEYLPPIKINQNNILIDGYHRWKAHQLEGAKEISVEVVETASEKELKRLAYQLNSNHGLQLTNDEKRRYATEMIGEMTVQALATILSVSESSVKQWTETQRKALEEERNRKILELYLRAQYTQEVIAEMFGITHPTVSNVVNNAITGEIYKDFTPPIYNIWNLQKQDNATTSHFGSFPLYFMKSLLYYHTEPWDIVFDPFAGGGTTIDACKEMLRRYLCTDRIVKPGREKDIQQHDITEGLPDMPKPDMVFLDPPYWIQAENKYSDSPNDFGNMSLSEFYNALGNLLDEITKRKVNKIALIISPTQYPNDLKFEDHIFEINKLLNTSYEIEMRYIIPYSSQQYNGTQVDIAKKNKVCLSLNRDLVVWRKR
jgi:hypothetical protein